MNMFQVTCHHVLRPRERFSPLSIWRLPMNQVQEIPIDIPIDIPIEILQWEIGNAQEHAILEQCWKVVSKTQQKKCKTLGILSAYYQENGSERSIRVVSFSGYAHHTMLSPTASYTDDKGIDGPCRDTLEGLFVDRNDIRIAHMDNSRSIYEDAEEGTPIPIGDVEKFFETMHIRLKSRACQFANKDFMNKNYNDKVKLVEEAVQGSYHKRLIQHTYPEDYERHLHEISQFYFMAIIEEKALELADTFLEKKKTNLGDISELKRNLKKVAIPELAIESFVMKQTVESLTLMEQTSEEEQKIRDAVEMIKKSRANSHLFPIKTCNTHLPKMALLLVKELMHERPYLTMLTKEMLVPSLTAYECMFSTDTCQEELIALWKLYSIRPLYLRSAAVIVWDVFELLFQHESFPFEQLLQKWRDISSPIQEDVNFFLQLTNVTSDKFWLFIRHCTMVLAEFAPELFVKLLIEDLIGVELDESDITDHSNTFKLDESDIRDLSNTDKDSIFKIGAEKSACFLSDFLQTLNEIMIESGAIPSEVAVQNLLSSWNVQYDTKSRSHIFLLRSFFENAWQSAYGQYYEWLIDMNERLLKTTSITVKDVEDLFKSSTLYSVISTQEVFAFQNLTLTQFSKDIVKMIPTLYIKLLKEVYDVLKAKCPVTPSKDQFKVLKTDYETFVSDYSSSTEMFSEWYVTTIEILLKSGAPLTKADIEPLYDKWKIPVPVDTKASPSDLIKGLPQNFLKYTHNVCAEWLWSCTQHLVQKSGATLKEDDVEALTKAWNISTERAVIIKLLTENPVIPSHVLSMANKEMDLALTMADNMDCAAGKYLKWLMDFSKYYQRMEALSMADNMDCAAGVYHIDFSKYYQGKKKRSLQQFTLVKYLHKTREDMLFITINARRLAVNSLLQNTGENLSDQRVKLLVTKWKLSQSQVDYDGWIKEIADKGERFNFNWLIGVGEKLLVKRQDKAEFLIRRVNEYAKKCGTLSHLYDPLLPGELHPFVIKMSEYIRQLAFTPFASWSVDVCTYLLQTNPRPAEDKVRALLQKWRIKPDSHAQKLIERLTGISGWTTKLADIAAQCAEDNATIELVKYIEENGPDTITKMTWLATTKKSEKRKSKPKEKDASNTEEKSKPKEKDASNTVEKSEPKEKDASNTEKKSEPKEKDACNTEEKSEPKEKDACNTEKSEPKEKDACNTEEKSKPKEKDACNTEKKSEPKEKDACNTEEKSEPKEKDASNTEEKSEPKEDASNTEESEPKVSNMELCPFCHVRFVERVQQVVRAAIVRRRRAQQQIPQQQN